MRLRDISGGRGMAGLGMLIAAMFWRPLTTQTFFFRDLYLLFYPKKLLLARAIREGVLPLWDPFTNGGQPYLANPGNFAFHPSSVLYALLPPLTAFNWILVLHVVLCGIGAYWLARTLNLPQPAAFVSGAGYALCGYTLSAINLTLLVLALPWVPISVGLIHRALRDNRSLAPAAIAAALPLYCSAAELTALLFVTLAVWVGAVRYEGVSIRRKAASLAFVVVFAVALAALPIVPASSVIAQSSRAGPRSYQGFTTWSVSPQRLIELAVPRFFGSAATLDDRDYWGRRLESNGFPYILSIYFGIPALVLAVAGACHAREGGEVPRRALAAIAVVAMVLALGRWLPGFRLIYDFVPLVSRFRYPVKALIAALLPLSLLAGCGVASIGVNGRRAAVAISALAAAVAAALLLSTGFAAWFAGALSFVTPSRGQLAASFAHTALASAALALASALRRHKEWTIAAVVALDLAVAGYGVNVYAPRSLFDAPAITEAVRAATGEGRYHAVLRETLLRTPTNELRWLARWQMSTLAGFTAGGFGIPVVFHADYDGLAPRRIAALSPIVDRLPWKLRVNVLTLAGVRCFSTTDVVSVPGVVEIAEIAAPNGPIRFYANAAAMPARFVSSVDPVPSEAAAAKRFVLDADPSRLILERPSRATAGCGSAPVAVTKRTMNSASYVVDAPCDGYVRFAETDYDGWRITVDGTKVPILRADFAFSAVAVTRGRHAIEREFAQPYLGASALFSACALLLVFPAAAVVRRRAA